MPVTIRLGVPLALLVGLAIWGYDLSHGSRVELRIVSSQDLPISEAHVELFRYEPGAYSASPSAKIGDFDCPLGALSLSWEELGGGPALAKISAPGHGLGFALLEPGVTEPVVLGEATSAKGRIHAAPALLAGARVQAFGGGPRGVLLLETETDAEGEFVLEGFSSEIAFLLVRVFQSGFAVAELDWEVGGSRPLELTLEPTQALSGEIEFCSGFDPQPVEVRAYHVPGVHTTSELGKFRIEHLSPEPIRTALLLSSLPVEFTHRRVQVMVTDKPVKISIQRSATVQGQVINGNNGQGVPGAKVLHEHGPKGLEIVECAADGSFEIGRLPSGEVRLDADIVIEVASIPGDPNSPKRRRLIQGHVDIDLIEGETLPGVVITLY